jgi:two-component system response regulator AtoC
MKALVVDDNDLMRSNVSDALRADGWDVCEAQSAEQAFEKLHAETWSLVFCDVKLSEKSNEEGYAVLRRFTEEQPEAQIILMTGHGSAAGALDAVSSGAYDYLMKPFDIEELLRISRAVRRGIEKRNRRTTSGDLGPPNVYSSDIDLIGVCPAFVDVMKMVGRVAPTSLPILVTGESGTGKEIVARSIHARSPRVSHPFVAVNCGAMPSELIESELFGHVRGSFTGATADRRGLLQEADGGTIFLDEITETTPAFQVKLLRALQEGEVRRVGANNTTRVDVRVITATNRDIEQEMREGRFRQDLLYRLNAVTLHLPPLRKRSEDIVPLARYFIQKMVPAGNPPIGLSRESIEVLGNYDWPGNIRELENAIVRATALCDQIIRPEDLPERIRQFSKTRAGDVETGLKTGVPDSGELLSLFELEGRHIARVLKHTKGNKQAAARLLGIDRTTLQRMMKRHQLTSLARDGNPNGLLA